MNGTLDTLRNYREIAAHVKAIVRKMDPEARVYVFGSVVKGEYTAASDIDVLVVTERIEKKYDLMIAMYKALPDAPIELHVSTPEQLESWYRRFMYDELEEIRD